MSAKPKPFRPYANQREWNPTKARSHYRRPEVGMVVGKKHAVWRVAEVSDPGPKSDGSTAYMVALEFLGGVLPDGFGDKRTGYVSVPAGALHPWYVYPDGRWPMCSCCGEPMPCRAAIQDDQIGAALDKVEVLESRMPGCCWGCGDPIGSRQHSIRYAGENLDLPGGIPVEFHLRAGCTGIARSYEARWLAADSERRRILTYPKCGGTLVSHADGTHECLGERRDPECMGRLSHDHGHEAGCRWVSDDVCPRGCPPENSYIRNPKRPKLRDPELPQGRIQKPEGPDTRPACHGTLFTHGDGTGDCKGGRDDCWDGSKYRHELKRSCQSLSHGCPQCEVAL